MQKYFKLVYMFFFHPLIFWKLTIKRESRYFLCNGIHQNIRGINNIVAGKDVRIGDYTRIQFYGNGKLLIGDGCYMCQRNSFLVGEDIEIGDGVLMASDILISSESHGMDPENINGYGSQSLVCKKIKIGRQCWIGEKTIIMAGVSIGEHSIVGAGSVVTHDLPCYAIAVGNPARVIKIWNFENKKWEKI